LKDTRYRDTSLLHCLQIFPSSVSWNLRWGCSAAAAIRWNRLSKSLDFTLAC